VENFSEKTYNGHKDVDITELGVRQMEAVASWLEGESLSGVYCSGLTRTKKGADIIAAKHNLASEPHLAFMELDIKPWEGLNAYEIEERFPGAFEAWTKNAADYKISGGESVRELSERVVPALREIIAAKQGKNIALVAHGAVNRVIIADAMKLDLNNIYSIEQDYGCINIIDYFSEHNVIKLLNGQLLDEC
jgi:alpha-ribazole phosphatase/probable phosphoglycerate mutase